MNIADASYERSLRQITRWLALFGICGETPFAIYRFWVGDLVVGYAATTIIAAQLGICWYLRRGGPAAVGAHVLAAIYSTGVVVVALNLGAMGSYWLFPVVVANFYMLPLRSGLVYNALVSVGATPLLVIDPVLGVRFLVTLSMVCVFGYVFSSEMARQRAALRRLAMIDPLTGIGNRRALEAELTRVAQELRYGVRTTLIMLDLDHFKAINDEHGHAMGDGVICTIVQALSQRLREADRIYRYGGEEFVLVLHHIGITGGVQLAEELRSLIAELELPTGARVTASFGVAEWCKGESQESWLARTDAMMYAAKDHGRNQVRYDAEPDPAIDGKVSYLSDARSSDRAAEQ